MHSRYTVYRGGAPNARARQYNENTVRLQRSQYCIKKYLNCIAAAIHLVLWKKLSKISTCFRLDCIGTVIRFI